MKSKPNYFSFCSWDNDDALVGIRIDDDRSVIEQISAQSPSFEVKAALQEVTSVSDWGLLYYDYSNDEIGVVDLNERCALWALQLKDVKFFCYSNSGEVIVQAESVARGYSAQTGALIWEKEINGTLAGFGKDWRVLARKGRTVVEAYGETRDFDRRESLGLVERFEEYIVIIERQGPLRVVESVSHSVQREVYPESGSEFGAAVVLKGGGLIATQHYFDDPRETRIKTYLDASEDFDEVCVPISGEYVLLGKGTEIAFVTRKIYSCVSGKLLKTF